MLKKFLGKPFDLNPRLQEDAKVIGKLIYVSEQNNLFGFKILKIDKWCSKMGYQVGEIYFFTTQNLPLIKLIVTKKEKERENDENNLLNEENS